MIRHHACCRASQNGRKLAATGDEFGSVVYCSVALSSFKRGEIGGRNGNAVPACATLPPPSGRRQEVPGSNGVHLQLKSGSMPFWSPSAATSARGQEIQRKKALRTTVQVALDGRKGRCKCALTWRKKASKYDRTQILGGVEE